MKISKNMRNFLICYSIVMIILFAVTKYNTQQELNNKIQNMTFEIECQDGIKVNFTVKDKFVCGELNPYNPDNNGNIKENYEIELQ